MDNFDNFDNFNNPMYYGYSIVLLFIFYYFQITYYCLKIIRFIIIHDFKEFNDVNDVNESNNHKIIIIGIAGRKGSGKDTIGDHLCKKYGFTKLALADPLKNACRDIFGFSDAQLYDQKDKEVADKYWGYSPRKIFQLVGTDLFRNELTRLAPTLDNIWERSIERKMYDLIDKGKKRIVITDIRFESNVEFVKKWSGDVWKVSRGNNQKIVVFSDPNEEHTSNFLNHVDNQIVLTIRKDKNNVIKNVMVNASSNDIHKCKQDVNQLIDLSVNNKLLPKVYNVNENMVILDNHESEDIEKLKVDVEIINNKSFLDLYNKVDEEITKMLS